MYEFGPNQGIPVEELMGCFSEHAIGHKDADVREAAKEVALQASQIIGVDIGRFLDRMPERHRRAVMNAAAAVEATRAVPESDGSPAKLRYNNDVHQRTPLLRRGRGRGRGRSRDMASFG